MENNIDLYNRKRNFNKTKEPKGEVAKAGGNLFVIQEHFASRHHFDLRLEINGVLKSWAVPKGPSLNPKIKRLAVHVEDHPLDYGNFEGVIPKGEYGGGKVILWDKGTWHSKTPDKLKAYESGKIEFTLDGKKLHGSWVLARTKMGKTNKQQNWLLVKKEDKDANSITDITKEHPESVKIHKGHLEVSPQLATVATTPPTSNNFIHEVKFDGYRTIAKLNQGVIDLYTRNGKNWTHRYPLIATSLMSEKLYDTILDGEVVHLDHNGRTSFEGLQKALKESRHTELFYYVFDVLKLNGDWVLDLPQEIRKGLCWQVVNQLNSERVLYSEHFTESAQKVYEQCCSLGLEGIISKNALSPYIQDRNSNWLKIKCENEDEFAIIGFIERSDSAQEIGALILAIYENNEFIEVGKVGTGFDRRTRQELFKRFNTLIIKSPEAKTNLSDPHITWIKPKHSAQIRYTELTQSKKLRHPVYLGLREDVSPKDAKLKKLAANDESFSNNDLATIISSPTKIVFGKGNITKLELADYYNHIYKYMSPHVCQKILTLLKCPKGVGDKCFYNKHIGNMKHMQPVSVGEESFFTIENLNGLLHLVRYNALEIHTWNSRAQSPEVADELIFDLDPDESLKSSIIIDAAFEFKESLEVLGLKSFPKLTGGKGIHIHIPLTPLKNTEDIYNFSKSFALIMEEQNSNRYTTNIRKDQRTSKIYIDYVRNHFGASYICPYSTRAKDYAPLSLPMSWKSLKDVDLKDPISLKDFMKRIKAYKNPWKEYWQNQQTIEVLNEK